MPAPLPAGAGLRSAPPPRPVGFLFSRLSPSSSPLSPPLPAPSRPLPRPLIAAQKLFLREVAHEQLVLVVLYTSRLNIRFPR
jgi:hypothetical protein